MGFFKESAGGFMDEIRCDESEYLIWQWHPKGSQQGSNNREHAIRWGSSLRVRDGSVAVFVYNQKNGVYEDFIEGPYDQILKTSNLPVLASIVGWAYDGGTPFQAEVYFINLAQVIQIRFGIPYFDVFDPRFLDFGVPVAVRGTLTFHIEDYREFIKLHRLDNFDLDTFKGQIKDAVTRYVKSAVANAPSDYGIPLVQIERSIGKIHEYVEPELRERLSRDFGVALSGIDISAIEPDKTTDGYRRLMQVTRDIEQATVQAQADINIKNLHDQQRINTENLEETLRVQREEAQRAQRMATETANIAAFQLEKQAEVGVAGATALGQMGAGGTTGSSTSGGFDPAAMMASLAIGGAVGQNVAGMMGSMMGGLADVGSHGQQTPPPVPQLEFYIAREGTPVGPFDTEHLAQMVSSGELQRESLVWRPGMPAWAAMRDVDGLGKLFGSGSDIPAFPDMPPIPDNQ